MNNKFKYRLKVKSDNYFDLINQGYVVSQTDCIVGEFWLLTNSPNHLTMFVEGDGLEIVTPAEEISSS